MIKILNKNVVGEGSMKISRYSQFVREGGVGVNTEHCTKVNRLCPELLKYFSVFRVKEHGRFYVKRCTIHVAVVTRQTLVDRNKS